MKQGPNPGDGVWVLFFDKFKKVVWICRNILAKLSPILC